jgi:hypothetical protein
VEIYALRPGFRRTVAPTLYCSVLEGSLPLSIILVENSRSKPKEKGGPIGEEFSLTCRCSHLLLLSLGKKNPVVVKCFSDPLLCGLAGNPLLSSFLGRYFFNPRRIFRGDLCAAAWILTCRRSRPLLLSLGRKFAVVKCFGGKFQKQT